MVAPKISPGDAPQVARPRAELTVAEARELRRLNARVSRLETELDRARVDWARFVRATSTTAVGLEMGRDKRTIHERARGIEKRAKKTR
jgi:hypothetical protein